MDLPPDSVIEERLVKTFPNGRLRELARATGLVQRDGGKLEADALFWSLTIGFGTGHYRTLEEFRQKYIDTFGGTLRTRRRCFPKNGGHGHSAVGVIGFCAESLNDSATIPQVSLSHC